MLPRPVGVWGVTDSGPASCPATAGRRDEGPRPGSSSPRPASPRTSRSRSRWPLAPSRSTSTWPPSHQPAQAGRDRRHAQADGDGAMASEDTRLEYQMAQPDRHSASTIPTRSSSRTTLRVAAELLPVLQRGGHRLMTDSRRRLIAPSDWRWSRDPTGGSQADARAAHPGLAPRVLRALAAREGAGRRTTTRLQRVRRFQDVWRDK